MSYRGCTIASVVTVLLLAAVAAVALHRLPPGAMLPRHWNAAGQPDGYSSAAVALFGAPLLAAVTSLLMAVLPRSEPLQNRLEASMGLLSTAWLGMLAMTVLTQVQVAASAFGWALPARLPLAGMGLLLMVIGNALPKSRPGFFVGIRTPWTLSDPENWIATHRLGARTMVAGGMLIVIAALPMPAPVRAGLMFAGLAVAVVPPILYSFWFWHTHRTA